MAGVDALVEAATRWYLAWEPEGDLERRRSPPGATASSGSPRCSASSAPTSAGARREQTAERLVGAGVPEPSSRARTRCGPSSRTRRTWSRSRAPPAARSRRSRAVFFAVGAELRARLARDRARRASRRPRGCSAGRCRPCARTPRQARRELAGARCWPRPTSAGAEARRGASSPSARDARAGASTAFLRSLSREGEPDLAGPHAGRPPAARTRG